MSKLKQLYERDFNLWRQQIAIAITNKDYIFIKAQLKFLIFARLLRLFDLLLFPIWL